MKKSGPLNDALQDIVELDRQLRAHGSGAVVAFDEVRYLARQRRDKVRQLQTADRGQTGW